MEVVTQSLSVLEKEGFISVLGLHRRSAYCHAPSQSFGRTLDLGEQTDVTQPVSTPVRASLLTALWPQQSGFNYKQRCLATRGIVATFWIRSLYVSFHFVQTGTICGWVLRGVSEVSKARRAASRSAVSLAASVAEPS